MASSIAKAAYNVLSTCDVNDKVALTHTAAEEWFSGTLSNSFEMTPPARPGRPDKPDLLLPKDMPRRRGAKGNAARIAMLHAIAHIELNAIDLAWDIVIRFGDQMPRDFISDWVKVADDEARHFAMLNKRLNEMDSFYGVLPAHDGLWHAAKNTSHDLLARLAIVPLVLEARGLDVTPNLIKKFNSVGDHQSASVLEIIYTEEIDHVRAGQRWFNYLCDQQSLNPQETYQTLVEKYFAGHIKPPFNIEARNQAGFDQTFYMPLAKL